MTIYLPYYDHGRKAGAVDPHNARRLPHGSILYYGTIYNGDFLFSSPEAVARYWAKKPALHGDILPRDIIK